MRNAIIPRINKYNCVGKKKYTCTPIKFTRIIFKRILVIHITTKIEVFHFEKNGASK